jgi:hypothetical protein
MVRSAGAILLLLQQQAPRTVFREPTLSCVVDNDYLVVASYAGAPSNPPWYYNLIANPTVGVAIGIELFTARG